jgi:hypothetical protein
LKSLETMNPYELGESNNKNAIEHVIAFLKNGSPNEKRLSASAINKLSKIYNLECIKSIPYLLKNLNTNFHQVKHYTLKALLNFDLSLYDLSGIFKISKDSEEKYYNKFLAKKIIQKNSEKCSAFKKNYKEFKNILQINNITRLFHFTDYANLESIKKYKGLYSWYYCQNNNIKIPQPGGNDLSRELDQRKNIHDYVRLGFAENHPMLNSCISDKRIENPIILEIDLSVIYLKETKFSYINAADSSIEKEGINGRIKTFKRIRFDIINSGDNSYNNYKYMQAEVLVKQYIPFYLILNFPMDYGK